MFEFLNPKEKKYLWWTMALGLITHLVAVYFSEGYHRPDEHLGMMRFLSFKLGTFPEKELNWEYFAQIRPWLQPAIYYGITKLSQIENPFFLAMVFRLFSSLLGFISLVFLADLSKFLRGEKNRIFYFFTLFLFFYFPFFHARTTAENFGTSFFIFALIPFLHYAGEKVFNNKITLKERAEFKVPTLPLFFMGVNLGLCFLFRFQMGIMIFFLSIWAFFFLKIKPGVFFKALFGFALVMGIGTFVDFWGYGEWTFTPWNYFHQNLVADKASQFGISPWYYYFTKTLLRGIPPLSLVILIPLFWIWIKRPFHIFTWLTLPFILIHSWIGHKEIRFLFGIGIFAPFLAFYFWQEVKGAKSFLEKKWFRGLVGLMILQNMVFLVISSTKPAFSPINFYKYLFQKDETISTIYSVGEFKDILKFYLKGPLEIINKEKDNQMDEAIKSAQSSAWVLTSRYKDMKKITNSYPQCKVDWLSYPKWMLGYKIGKWPEGSKVWSLIKCDRAQVMGKN